MTYFHRSNFRRFDVNPAVVPPKIEQKIAVEIETEFPLRTEQVQPGKSKIEKVPG